MKQDLFSGHIMIAGLTAAGKTTHSKLLAGQFGWDYLSASILMTEITRRRTTVDLWLSDRARELEKLRISDRSYDHWIDEQLLDRVSNPKPAVFDTFGLPWMTTTPSLRVWIESNLESRILKAIVSALHLESVPTSEEIRQRLIEKDNASRLYFLEEYKSDIFTEYAIFDFSVDISDFITAPTLDASATSIRLSHEIILAGAQAYFLRSAQAIDNWRTTFQSHRRRITLSPSSPLAVVL